MNSSVHEFTPLAELGAQVNLEAFIALWRQSAVLDARTQFDSNIWITGHQKGHNKILRSVFSTMEAASLDKSDPSMSSPFLDFAKAALVYLQSSRPVVSQAVRLSALRYLDAALRDLNKGSRPTAVNSDVLDRAVELTRSKVSASVAYRVAGQLEIIAKFMVSEGFIVMRQSWIHGLKKPTESGSRISKEALQARQEKLPSEATLRALGSIFYEASALPDVIVSSYMALMLSAPERINEALRLRRNCIVDGDNRFVDKMGLRWPGSKGFDTTTKWLPTQMAPIAREAVENILAATDPGHELAVWYTDNPSSMYYHPGAHHLREKEYLNRKEIAILLWGDAEKHLSAATWLQYKYIQPSSPGRPIRYYREDVERAVIGMLPRTFPYVPGDTTLPFKDALSVVRVNELHDQKATYLCMFEYLDYAIIDNRLGVPGKMSIFDRLNYSQDDGARIELNSHSLRHYLNMLAQMGGLSNAEIAIFSGRKDIKQNRAYDHMSSEEVQAPIGRAIKAGFTTNLLPASTYRELVIRSDFEGIGVVAAHTTDYGWCMHNFAAEPCQMYRDCINCEEQECVKGDAQKETNLRKLKDETEYLLGQARQALSGNEYGADTWVKHQTMTLERVNALLGIMDDPNVPYGARIRLDTVSNAPLVTNQPTALPLNTRRVRKALK